MDNKTKEIILSRLFKSSGFFSGGMEHLPDTLKTDDVLKAINVDEYFYLEPSEHIKESD